MLSNITIGPDLCWIFTAVTPHDQSGLPFVAGAPAKMYPTLEMPAPMYWPPGMASGANKLTDKVLHRKCGIVQQGHDCGPGMIHIALAPYAIDAMCVVHALFSSRKPMFDVQKVRMQGAATAAGSLPMLVCSDPTALPVGLVPSAHANSVLINVTAMDMFRCIGVALVSAVVDLVFAFDRRKLPTRNEAIEKLAGGIEKLWDSMGRVAHLDKGLLVDSLKTVARESAVKTFGYLHPEKLTETVVKTAVATATGFVSSLGGTETKIGMSLPGNPFFGYGRETTIKDGRIEQKVTSRKLDQEVQESPTGKTLQVTDHSDNVSKHSHDMWSGSYGQVIK